MLHSVGGFEHRTLQGWVEKYPRSSVTTERDGAKTLVRVDVPAEKANLACWLDPALNYQIRRTLLTRESGEVVETVSEGFVEASPGVYFPAKTRRTIRAKADAPSTGGGWEATVSQIVAGKPLPAEAMAFKFPAGILVNNTLTKELLRTDGQGVPRLAPKTASGIPIRLGSLPVAPPPEATRTAAGDPISRAATAEEPASLSPWLIGVGVALVLAGVALLVVRYARRHRPADE